MGTILDFGFLKSSATCSIKYSRTLPKETAPVKENIFVRPGPRPVFVLLSETRHEIIRLMSLHDKFRVKTGQIKR